MPNTLPSGLVLNLRSLTGKDFRYLADEEVVRDDAVEDFILDNCATQIVDPGPYKISGGKFDWSRALVGDGLYAFLEIRRMCYPDKPFVFPVKCASRTCKLFKKGFEWEINVSDFLEEKAKFLSDADREIVKAGNRFDATIPSTGAAYSFKLKTREDARRFKALVKQVNQSGKKKKEEFNLVVASMAFSILEIDGVPKERGFNARVAYLENLPIADIDGIMAEMEAHDCGIETTVRAECPECEMEREIELPFARSFFFPKSGTAKKKAAPELEPADETNGETSPEI